MDGNDYITLSQASRLFPRRRGKTVSTATLRRRIARGVSGVRLRAIRDGRHWYTTQAWVTEYLHEVTRATLPGPPHTDASNEQHRAAVDNLERKWGLRCNSASTVNEKLTDEACATRTTSRHGGE